MNGIRVEIPHTPAPTLNPNDTNHPLADLGPGKLNKVQARMLLRRSARLATLSHLNRSPWSPPRSGRINLELFVFWERGRIPENREMPDDDNLIASCKALIDGIADALGVNDKRFKFRGIEQDRHPDGTGCVIAIISTD